MTDFTREAYFTPQAFHTRSVFHDCSLSGLSPINCNLKSPRIERMSLECVYKPDFRAALERARPLMERFRSL